MQKKYPLVVIGGGPAGMAAALAAEAAGVEDILLLERDYFLGGILPQCIHNGFGLVYFKEELTGPEYAHRFIDRLAGSKITVKTGTMVININENKQILALNEKEGILEIEARSIILAMGCRERTREAIKIPGDRIAGVLTAGTAQRFINIEGYMPGKKVVILGSGDIGLIMARRMKLEGAEVLGVFELMPFSSGLIRNKVQCLDDFDIPLHLNHTITRIEGGKRVEKVFIAEVDDNLKPDPATEEILQCDTVLMAVGLIPENELSKEMGINLHSVTGGPLTNEDRETEIEGVFACGNVLQVHDLVDYVTEEGEIAGKAAAKFLSGKREKRKERIDIKAGDNVNYIVPGHLEYGTSAASIKLFFRVKKPMEEVRVDISNAGDNLFTFKRDFVTPGEMVSVPLPLSRLNNQIKELTVSISKRG